MTVVEVPLSADGLPGEVTARNKSAALSSETAEANAGELETTVVVVVDGVVGAAVIGTVVVETTTVVVTAVVETLGSVVDRDFGADRGADADAQPPVVATTTSATPSR